jgi:hypothetical protein
VKHLFINEWTINFRGLKDRLLHETTNGYKEEVLTKGTSFRKIITSPALQVIEKPRRTPKLLRLKTCLSLVISRNTQLSSAAYSDRGLMQTHLCACTIIQSAIEHIVACDHEITNGSFLRILSKENYNERL